MINQRVTNATPLALLNAVAFCVVASLFATVNILLYAEPVAGCRPVGEAFDRLNCRVNEKPEVAEKSKAPAHAKSTQKPATHSHICPDCRGEGERVYDDRHTNNWHPDITAMGFPPDDPDKIGPLPFTYECWTCRGTGRVAQ